MYKYASLLELMSQFPQRELRKIQFGVSIKYKKSVPDSNITNLIPSTEATVTKLSSYIPDS